LQTFSPDAAERQGTGSKERQLYAVVVGVKSFKDPEIPGLTRADRDAEDFSTFCKERKELFSKAHLTLLLNEKATRANVASALRQDLKPAGKNDIVIVYLSGHGATDPAMPNEYYFVTYDAKLSNLFGTALLMNDPNLFKGVDSNNVFLITDACYSGGFSPGIEGATAKSADRFLATFHDTRGRIAMSSSRPDEKSYEKDVYGNSIFTHFLIKGLRGQARIGADDGTITAKDLYDYVYKNTRTASNGLQNPQLYFAKGAETETPVFLVPKFANSLNVKAQFFYEDEGEKINPLTDQSVLKSGQHLGVAFRVESDCYVYIFWWDSTGGVGRLFPNPQLTEGTGEVKAGQTYWLPSRGGERWYVLDDHPGTETVYFVATRSRNEKLENLYKSLTTTTAVPVQKAQDKLVPGVTQNELAISAKPSKPEQEKKKLTGEMARELSLMGFAEHTAPKGVQKVSFHNKERLFEEMENQIKISGAEAVYKVEFRHIPR
jgi:hypothetical protein